MNKNNKVALVTGSASGIGATVAITLANAGYDVIVNYSRSAESAQATVAACEAAGAKTLLVQCDVSDESSVKAMMASIREHYSHLDVVCSNAGVSIDTPPKHFHEIDVDDWDRVFSVNVRGLFLIAKHARELLLEADKPCMVNTASIVGMRPGAQPLPYSASKAAARAPPRCSAV